MRNWIVLCLLCISAIANAQINKVIGFWNTIDDKTGDMRSCIQITEKDGIYHGTIVAVYEKENEGAVGTEIFIDMKVHKDHLKGKVYDPESGKTYFGKVSYEAKTDALVLRGSLDKAGLLGRSQTWERKK